MSLKASLLRTIDLLSARSAPVSALPLLLTDKLIECLRTLCAQPSPVGHADDLERSAELLAGMFHALSMQVQVARAGGPPVVIGRRAGRSERTLLLYHRFDAPPPGPWRDWSHEPYQLAEREGALYGRGVSEGKGPLAAHLQAFHALLQAEGELPCGVVVVADGGGLVGSPGLAEIAAAYPELLRADAYLGSMGERDTGGTPFCYSGSKGMLQVRLSVQGAAHPLPAGTAPSLPNPLWRLVWALSHIKGDDEDIRIPGFYELVEGPSREENTLLRQIHLDEAGRLAAWGASGFLFGLSGAALVRAEVTLPTCNVSAVRCEPEGELALLPASASAVLDFQLVPRQQPGEVAELLGAHLRERNFEDVRVEALPGGYGPARRAPDTPFIRQLMAAGAPVFGVMLPVVSSGPFPLPLELLAGPTAPLASVGVLRPDSTPYGPDEHIPLDDLSRHGQLLIELLLALGDQ